jgi:hypothetical protein
MLIKQTNSVAINPQENCADRAPSAAGEDNAYLYG